MTVKIIFDSSCIQIQIQKYATKNNMTFDLLVKGHIFNKSSY